MRRSEAGDGKEDSMNIEPEIKVGDLLENTSPSALARKIRVTAVTATELKADVIEGLNTKVPLTVFRAGWHLYRKLVTEGN